MAAVKKHTILWTVLLLMAILNAITLYLYLQTGKKEGTNSHRPGPPEQYLVEAVGMDDQQAQQYQDLAKTHRAFLDSMQSISLSSRLDFFALISTEAPDSVWQAAQAQMDSIKHVLDDRTFRHFRTVSQLLRQDQLPAFQEAVVKILRRPPPGHRDRKGQRPPL